MRTPILLSLLTATLTTPSAWAEDPPQAVFAARVPATQSLEPVLDGHDQARVAYRTVGPEHQVAVFVAADREPGQGVRRLAPLVTVGERGLAVYRLRFRVQFGSLPLPTNTDCPELDSPPQGIEGLELLQQEACMNRLVREGLVKATTREAEKAAKRQLDTVLAAFKGASPDSPVPDPQVVTQSLRTFLVATANGERQEAEAEVVFVALDWGSPFESQAEAPVRDLRLEQLTKLTAASSTTTAAPGEPRRGIVDGLGE